jgi:hypothetical protein
MPDLTDRGVGAFCLMAPGGLMATIWPAPRDCGRKSSPLTAPGTEKCEEYFAFWSRCVVRAANPAAFEARLHRL